MTKPRNRTVTTGNGVANHGHNNLKSPNGVSLERRPTSPKIHSLSEQQKISSPDEEDSTARLLAYVDGKNDGQHTECDIELAVSGGETLQIDSNKARIERRAQVVIDHLTQLSLLPRQRRRSIREEIHSLVLWRRPFHTVYYAVHQSVQLVHQLFAWILAHTKLCLLAVVLLASFTTLMQLEGVHQPYVQLVYKRLLWCSYWVGLGILSSVGLGTGLHTFILYLGPHIAAVTLAAYECNSLDFPEPPYPDEILCPADSVATAAGAINIWSIMSKVRLEAFMWGAGTALGELPPYFISRAHRLANDSSDDDDNIMEELEELEELVPEFEQEGGGVTGPVVQRQRRLSIAQKVKANMIFFMKRMGFIGILACASIPNPLFDLAGIICGYSLISFWTFFGATLLGKAVIKMHIQKLVVIIVFNETYVTRVLEVCRNIPYIGINIHDMLRDYLQQQKKSLHRGAEAAGVPSKGSWIAFAFDAFVIAMVSYFLLSIINSMAQSNLKQRYLKKLEIKKGTHTSSNNSTAGDEPKQAKKD